MPLLRFIPEATKIDFVGLRYIAFAIDGLLLVASIVLMALGLKKTLGHVDYHLELVPAVALLGGLLGAAAAAAAPPPREVAA